MMRYFDDRYQKSELTMTPEQAIKARLNAYRTRTKRLLGFLPDDVVDVQYLKELWESQYGKCHYLSKPISLNGDPKSLTSAHLDKVVPSKGYVKGNVVWSSRAMNNMRNDTEYQAFVNFLMEHDIIRYS